MRFTIYQEPTPKGRPRVTMRGRHPLIYTPQETKQSEINFQEEAKQYAPDVPFENALIVKIVFYKLKPKSYPKRITQWVKKPDVDNLAKLVLDAMNKIFYFDDSQIVSLNVSKCYGEENKIVVTIDEDKDES